MNNKKKRKIWRVLALMAVLVLASVAVLSAFAVLESNLVKQAELDAALEKSRLERSLLLLADEQKKFNQIQEQSDNLLQAELRRTLQEGFLSRNREVLMMLVNPWNPLPEGYEPQLVPIGDEMYLDERAAEPLRKMLEACLADGVMSVPISGYRTQEYQQGLYDNKIARLREDGWPEELLEEEAAKSVAVPGTSEHQLGLAMDILDVNNPNLDITQEWTNAQRWLMKHCWEYGFILRYPNGTTEITGIIYEPWHYRYVGKTIAAAVTESGMTFEEFLAKES